MSRANNSVSAFLTTLVLATVPLTAHAGVTVFADQAQWESWGFTPNFFDDLNSGSGGGGVINRGAYSITGTAQNAFPNTNTTTTIDGSGYARLLLGPDNYTTITFVEPVHAFGFDINPFCNAGCTTPGDLGATISVAVDGVPTTSFNLPVTDVTEFRGFYSDTAFT